jgi:hypothetical protein
MLTMVTYVGAMSSAAELTALKADVCARMRKFVEDSIYAGVVDVAFANIVRALRQKAVVPVAAVATAPVVSPAPTAPPVAPAPFVPVVAAVLTAPVAAAALTAPLNPAPFTVKVIVNGTKLNDRVFKTGSTVADLLSTLLGPSLFEQEALCTSVYSSSGSILQNTDALIKNAVYDIVSNKPMVHLHAPDSTITSMKIPCPLLQLTAAQFKKSFYYPRMPKDYTLYTDEDYTNELTDAAPLVKDGSLKVVDLWYADGVTQRKPHVVLTPAAVKTQPLQQPLPTLPSAAIQTVLTAPVETAAPTAPAIIIEPAVQLTQTDEISINYGFETVTIAKPTQVNIFNTVTHAAKEEWQNLKGKHFKVLAAGSASFQDVASISKVIYSSTKAVYIGNYPVYVNFNNTHKILIVPLTDTIADLKATIAGTSEAFDNRYTLTYKGHVANDSDKLDENAIYLKALETPIPFYEATTIPKINVYVTYNGQSYFAELNQGANLTYDFLSKVLRINLTTNRLYVFNDTDGSVFDITSKAAHDIHVTVSEFPAVPVKLGSDTKMYYPQGIYIANLRDAVVDNSLQPADVYLDNVKQNLSEKIDFGEKNYCLYYEGTAPELPAAEVFFAVAAVPPEETAYITVDVYIDSFEQNYVLPENATVKDLIAGLKASFAIPSENAFVYSAGKERSHDTVLINGGKYTVYKALCIQLHLTASSISEICIPHNTVTFTVVYDAVKTFLKRQSTDFTLYTDALCTREFSLITPINSYTYDINLWYKNKDILGTAVSAAASNPYGVTITYDGKTRFVPISVRYDAAAFAKCQPLKTAFISSYSTAKMPAVLMFFTGAEVDILATYIEPGNAYTAYKAARVLLARTKTQTTYQPVNLPIGGTTPQLNAAVVAVLASSVTTSFQIYFSNQTRVDDTNSKNLTTGMQVYLAPLRP